MDQEIRHRFEILTWAVGLAIALNIATLGMVTALAVNAMSLSRELGSITGSLAVLTQHVELK